MGGILHIAFNITGTNHVFFILYFILSIQYTISRTIPCVFFSNAIMHSAHSKLGLIDYYHLLTIIGIILLDLKLSEEQGEHVSGSLARKPVQTPSVPQTALEKH